MLVFTTMLDVTELNAYCVWNRNFPEWVDTYGDRARKGFLLQVAESMIPPHIAHRSLVGLLNDILHDMHRFANVSGPAVQHKAVMTLEKDDASWDGSEWPV